MSYEELYRNCDIYICRFTNDIDNIIKLYNKIKMLNGKIIHLYSSV